jgi:hypothetical protein
MNVTVLTLSDLTLTKSSLTFNLKVASQMPLLSVAILFKSTMQLTEVRRKVPFLFEFLNKNAIKLYYM